MRRYFVDCFFFRQVPRLERKSRILDLGGNKEAKRGQFNIEAYGLDVIYADITNRKRPDVRTDAMGIAFKDKTFHAVICSELLEHVIDPLRVLQEVSRVLKPGGVLLVCVPFLFRIHGDPQDFGRYTDFYWTRALEKTGFHAIGIEKQGLFWSVLLDMLRGAVSNFAILKKTSLKWIRRLAVLFLSFMAGIVIKHEAKNECRRDPYFASFTTGFGIRAAKND